MAGGGRCCDICCEPANFFDITKEGCKDLLPGSNGSRILNAHLRTYFIANKLLKCSETDSLSLLTAVTNCAQSMFSFCSECEETVTKALEMHCEMVALQSEINKLGKVLINQIKSCHSRGSSSRVAGSLGIKLRELLHLVCADGDDFGGQEITVVKQEQVDTEAIPCGDEDYEDYDDGILNHENFGIKDELLETIKVHQLCENDEKVSGKKIPKIKTYDRDANGNFICKLCESVSVYTTYPGITKHYRMHKESRSLGKIYDCSICRHPNLSDSKLRRHLKKFHPGVQKESVENAREHVPETTETNQYGDVEVDGQDIEDQDVDLKCNSDSESADSSDDYSPKFSRQRKSRKIKTKYRLIRANTSSKATTFAKSESSVANASVETYPCKLCESVYTTIPGINKHMRAHEQSQLLGNMFDCPTCKHPTVSESNLRRHITAFHHTKSSSACREESESNTNHATKQATPTGDTFACELCESVYTTLPGINKHKRAHEQSQLLGNKYDCPTCKHPTLSESKLRRHITKIHKNKSFCAEEEEITTSPSLLPSASKFTCERCESVYTTVGGIKKHTQIHMESDKLGNLFDCPVCRHPTVSDKNLRIHMSVSHQNKTTTSSADERHEVLNFPCERCETVYTSYTGIKKHQRIHKESDNLGNFYDCPVCRHPTVSEKNLRIHISTTHQNKITSECQQMIFEKFPTMDTDRFQVVTSGSNCEGETTTSTGNVSQQQSSSGNFCCDRCESVYCSVTGIRKHERIHEESDLLGNKYDCSICRHPTVSAKNLRIHMHMIHRVKMPFGKHEKLVNCEASISAPESSTTKVTSDTESDESETESTSYTQSMDGNFHCKFCDSVYTSFSGIRKHDLMHKKSNLLGNIFDCSICRHPNLSDSKLCLHMKKIHGKLQRRRKNCRETNAKLVEKLSVREDSLILQQQRKRSQTTSNIEPCNNDGNTSDDDDDDEGTKSDKDDKDWTPTDEFDTGKSSSKQQLTLYLNGDNELYHCDKCNIGYKSARGYQRHEEEHQASISLGHKYDCHCGFPASSEQRLRYHKRRVHLDAFTCSVCGYQVQKTEQLEGHMRKHYKSDKTIKSMQIKGNRSSRIRRIRDKKGPEKMTCQICKARYWYERSFKKHMEDHEKTKLIDNVWDCNICNFPCFSEDQLKRHKTKHGQRKVACTLCQRICANPTLLKVHMRIHTEYDKAEDPTTGLFLCTFCSYVGISRRALISHKTALHRESVLDSSVEYLLCPHCGKSFYNLGTLRKHIKNIHENTYTYNCEQCGKGFDSKSGFNNHKMIHQETRTRQYICDTCGASYSHKKSLQAHMSKYHSSRHDKVPAFARDGRRFAKARNYNCRWCHAVFPFKYMLLNHMPTAHKDLYTFSCDQCDKTYITSSSLKLHKEVAHSNGSQTFACKYCQKVFAHKHYATCHYRTCEAKRNIEYAESNAT